MVEELVKPQEVGDSRGLVLFVLGLILGLGIMFSMFYFFGGRSGSESVSILTPIVNGSSGSGSGSGLDSGTTIFRDSAGNLISVENGDNSKTSTFVDSTGKSKEVTCYTSVYCVEKCVDCDKPSIDCKDCKKENELCSYDTSSTAPSSSSGTCCDGLTCVYGKCKKDECVQANELCGSGPSSTAPGDYGDCCGDYQCTGGYCKPPIEQCKEKGQTCSPTAGPSYACCGDLTCTNDVCTEQPQCGDVSTPCNITTSSSSNPDGSTCCSDFVCQYSAGSTSYGFCQPKPCMTIGTCQTDASCCDGYYCDSSFQCTKKCTGTGGTCTLNTDCCTGNCIDGTCQTQCASTGAYCADSSECCNDYTCQAGVCAPPPYTPPSCGYENTQCSADSDCCSGYACNDAGVCKYQPTPPPPAECSQIGYQCSANSDCCSDKCNTGYCSDTLPDRPCVSYGASCSTDTCCSPYYCNPQTLQCSYVP